ncbi:V-type ATPase 116kDa subunit family protein [Pedococcus bigeumensis]|uniref:V-type ATPase 116kDa subunit family protein n=1 Tax=Pedococcus bigeumensis TaxID=433644 RepID=UPI002FE8014C
MRWRDTLEPAAMQRVALAACSDSLRDVLVQAADEGCVQLEEPEGDGEAGHGAAAERLLRLRVRAELPPTLSTRSPDLDRCERMGRLDLIAGEAAVEQRMTQALTRDGVSALVGWAPVDRLPVLADRVAGHGGAVVPLVAPRGLQPPTLLSDRAGSRDFAPLVETYATVPYADLNPSLLAGLAYVVMFGMMFADAGHGLLLLAAALVVRWRPSAWMRPARPVWLFLAGAGLMSIVFGALYGEFFGPTGVLPVLWLEPLQSPIELITASVVVGGVLLAGAYALGSVNRFREGGWRRAVYAPSGLAGATLFLALVCLASGLYLGVGALVGAAVVLAAAGLTASYAGLLAAGGGGAAGAVEAAVELFDLVVRLGSNLVSFARLAAFGLTHAALGAVVWDGTTGLWSRGGFALVGAVVLFLVGNAVTFALEGLVAAIQALRLEYYELFSRVFDSEGVPFRPWHIPITTEEVA